MRYQHPDLETITTFLRDFGMHVVKKESDRIWYGGYGPDQYVYYAQRGPKKFLGGTFEVETYADLEKYECPGPLSPMISEKLTVSRATNLPNAGRIQNLSDAPGGGQMVTVTDPEGYPLNLMYGAIPVKVDKFPEKIIHNTESEKPRQRKFARFQPGPAEVHKVSYALSCLT